MTSDDRILCRIECYLKEILEQGYGDPLDSVTESLTLATKFTAVAVTPRVSCLILENTGLIDIYWTLNPLTPLTTGKRLAASGGRIVLDRFRGTLFARGSGATLEIALLTWNRPLGGAV